jgi:hypothetical protein
VDQLLPDYRALNGEWMAEDPTHRGGIPMKHFAMEKLSELNADLFEHEYDLKRHVYALGKLAGRTVLQSRALSKNLWASSKHSTPWQEKVGQEKVEEVANGHSVLPPRTPPLLQRSQVGHQNAIRLQELHLPSRLAQPPRTTRW